MSDSGRQPCEQERGRRERRENEPPGRRRGGRGREPAGAGPTLRGSRGERAREVARAARELLFPLDFAVGESLHTPTTLRRPPHTHTFFVSSSSSSSERSFLSFLFFFSPLSHHFRLFYHSLPHDFSFPWITRKITRQKRRGKEEEIDR